MIPTPPTSSQPIALKTAVERAVRPITAPLETRQRMRAELYDLISAIHAEEAARGGDEAAILRRTLDRFGRPEDLTRELRQCLSWQQRWEGGLNRWFERRLSEQPIAFACRVGLSLLTMMLVLIGPIAWRQSQQSLRLATGSLSLAFALSGIIAIDGFLIAWLGAVSVDRVRQSTRAAWRHGRVWLAGCAAGLTVWLFGNLFFLIGSRGAWPTWREGWMWIVLGLVSAPCFVAVTTLVQRELRTEAEWLELDLSEPPPSQQPA